MRKYTAKIAMGRGISKDFYISAKNWKDALVKARELQKKVLENISVTPTQPKEHHVASEVVKNKKNHGWNHSDVNKRKQSK